MADGGRGRHVRLYDFGAVTIALRVPVADAPWTDFVRRLNAADHGVEAAGDTWDQPAPAGA